MSVHIVSMNAEGERVVASASRISTTEGDAFAIFNASTDTQKNRKLISKVLRSGHRSVAEHAVFTIALKDVSAYVEEFFIEHRLASFIVKSRRYVDFGTAGYYLPKLPHDAESLFRSHADYLFGEYAALCDAGVPKEDARFVLPYCFHSNFYCTINGRELTHLLTAIKCGRGRSCAELQDIADTLIAELKTLCPFVAELPEVVTEAPSPTRLDLGETVPNESGIDIVSHTHNAHEVILRAIQTSKSPEDYRRMTRGGSYDNIISQLIRDARPRELEQICATYVMRGLSLAGLTHIARHRIQSLIVPPLARVNPLRYVVPESISNELLERYNACYERTREVVRELRGLCGFEEYYLALAGNTVDIMTTMNARELALFCRLRCCNRAQWEIRALAVELLSKLREAEPELYKHFGPSCFPDGRCPEGRMSCGEMASMKHKFTM